MLRPALLALLVSLLVPVAAPAQVVSVPRKGGVNDGDTIIVRAGKRLEKVRILGVQAFELTAYNNNDPSKWRGECNAVPAARFVLRTIARGGHRVRLGAADAGRDSRGRLIRRVDVRLGGRWRDLGAMLLARGRVLWLHHYKDEAVNRRYNALQQTAALRRVGIWRPDACGAGPVSDAAFDLHVLSDPIGEDTDDLNSEWVRVVNTGPRAVPLGGWYLGHAGPKQERFHFPAGTVLEPGRTVTVYSGSGAPSEGALYRGRIKTLFENSVNGGGAGDGAYLVDPDGDVRAHAVYPCLVACADPAQGALAIEANPDRGPEHVLIRNVSGSSVDLFGYQLRLPGAYGFPQGSVLQPGETMQVFVKGSPAEDTRLVKHAGYGGAYLNDRGGSARVSTFEEVDVACDSWGSGTC